MRLDEEQNGGASAPREEEEQRLDRGGTRVLLPLLLFVATIFTTMQAGGPLFSATLLSILVAHEMGHYLVARIHKVEASLPHFIPMPAFFMLGTLGAVIGMRTDQANRNQLMDIGAAGPIAGFIVAVPAMAIGIAYADMGPIVRTGLDRWVDSPTLLMHYAGFVLPAAPGGLTFFGDSLLSGAMLKIFQPVLPAGYDIMANPIIIGAWGGFLVTAINLLPMGQLDGGHVLHALTPSRSEVWAGRVYRFLIWYGLFGLVVHGPTMLYGIMELFKGIVASAIAPSIGPSVALRAVEAFGLGGKMIPVSLFEALRPLFPWTSYAFLIWALFGKLTKLKHPPVVGEQVPLTPARKVIGAVAAIILILTFMPSPAWLDGVWKM